MSAALEAAYKVCPRSGETPAVDAIKTIELQAPALNRRSANPLAIKTGEK